MIRPLFFKLVCAITCLSLSAVGATAALGRIPSRPTHQVTFYSRRDGNFEIYLADTDRALVVNISRNEAEDTLPAWSPDGEQLIFYSTRGADEALYRIDYDGQPAYLFTESGHGETYPMWSPDGRSITYSSDRRGGVGIYTIDASGGEPKRITDYLAALMAYSPNGERIVFMADCDNNCDLFIMDADGQNIHAFTPRNGMFDVFPAWSPDSRQITFVSNRDRFFEIYVLDANCAELAGGCNARRLTYNRDFDGFSVWSPDGEKLLFSSNRNGNFELFSLDVTCINAPQSCDQMTRRLTHHPSRDTSPSWSPDGRWIAFISGRAVYVMDSNGGNIRHIMDDVVPDQFLIWRP
jgi:TolB protein